MVVLVLVLVVERYVMIPAKRHLMICLSSSVISVDLAHQ